MTMTIHTMQQRRSEYELADLLEDETLRMLDEVYTDSLGMPSRVTFFEETAKTVLKLILKSYSAFDALILVQKNDDEDIIGEVAREWLLDFGQGNLDSGAYFAERIIHRIDTADYQIKED